MPSLSSSGKSSSHLAQYVQAGFATSRKPLNSSHFPVLPAVLSSSLKASASWGPCGHERSAALATAAVLSLRLSAGPGVRKKSQTRWDEVGS